MRCCERNLLIFLSRTTCKKSLSGENILKKVLSAAQLVAYLINLPKLDNFFVRIPCVLVYLRASGLLSCGVLLKCSIIFRVFSVVRPMQKIERISNYFFPFCCNFVPFPTNKKRKIDHKKHNHQWYHRVSVQPLQLPLRKFHSILILFYDPSYRYDLYLGVS